MNAAVITKFGPPEVLQFRDVPGRSAGVGELRVRIRAIGVNFADIMARLGVYPGIPRPPFTPGIEFTGEVIEVGHGVKGFRRGDRVMAFSRQGAYAEEAVVPAEFARRVPAGMSDTDAAALAVTYLSAWHGMRTLGQVRQGETMLLHAAAGGVGTAALQLARHWGITTIATASTPEKLAVATELGATHTINYSTEDVSARVRAITNGRGVDLVMDSVGGKVFRSSWRLLAPMGRYILYGFAAVTGPKRLDWWNAALSVLRTPLVFPPTLTTRNVTLAGFNLYFLAERSEYLHGAMKEIMGLYRRRVIRPVVGRTFTFDRIVEAQEWLQSRRSIGKVVVTMT